MTPRISALLLSAAFAGLSATAVAADNHHPTKGGVFAEGKLVDFELVAKPTVLQLYVFDHGTPRDISKSTARVTLLSGADKRDVELKPAGDKLEAVGDFKVGAGTKAVAVVTDGGKSLGTAKFTLK